ncbi:MAG TPA: 3'(2'),5'-bisphosphate nucleotidase, partial [Thermodesulfobacteriota bacterium]|nr:3'(2'),5'-bisphosphate nucleotidase [Thermodesulfobacteriota bacterium]
MNYESELKVAVEAVRKASGLCVRVQSSLVSEETMKKKDDSPVTVADFGAQAVICRELMKSFPDIPIVAEEDSSELKSEGGKALTARILEFAAEVFPGIDEAGLVAAIDAGDYDGGAGGTFWTLDPIDGTKGFLRGEQYAVALALIENGRVVLGVLGCPNLSLDLKQPEGGKGCILTAVRGGGASIRPLDHNTPKRIAVSDIENTKLAPFCESVESAHSSHGDSARIAELLGVKAPPIRIDSQCKYAVIARGDASIYLRLPTKKEYVEKIWDHAAGSIIVEEAGGIVTDAYGKALDFSLGRTLSGNKGIVATNGLIHEKV